MLTLADVADSRSNNFRIVRLLAAASVMIAHSFGIIATSSEASDRSWQMAAVASMAVNVFCVASGLLVGRSLLVRGEVLDFVVPHVLCIYPALIVLAFRRVRMMADSNDIFSLRDYLSIRAVYSFAIFYTITIISHHFVISYPVCSRRSIPLHIASSRVVTLALPMLLWQLIEEPALRLKNRIRTKPAKRPPPLKAAHNFTAFSVSGPV